jgi:thiamine monophosphate kinase
MQRWIIEWGGAGVLGGQGITRDSLKAGDVIVITGAPGRDATEHRLRMINLRRPSDGFSYGMKEGEKFE